MGVLVSKRMSRAATAKETQHRILTAAEMIFARDGFNGASMRSISEAADVASGLLHYHFENKQTLYASVVGWRAETINRQRLELLTALPTDRSLSDILHTLFKPAMGEDAGGAGFGRIMASLMTGEAMHQDLVARYYDATAQIFIDAIADAEGLQRDKAAWGYSLAIHVLVAGMARSGRTERLAEEMDTVSAEMFLKQLVAFAAGGITQLAAKPGH